ncbi:hypothetical protein J6590_038274 [Homalodisca vitripennis]|nr:hypothetical protein J6590_038274 [Homalodisca vitripennis]
MKGRCCQQQVNNTNSERIRTEIKITANTKHATGMYSTEFGRQLAVGGPVRACARHHNQLVVVLHATLIVIYINLSSALEALGRPPQSTSYEDSLRVLSEL